MINAELLEEKRRQRGYTLEKMASELGISRTCLWNKIHGETQFYIGEAAKIKEMLKLSKNETFNIFFATKVHPQ